MKRKRTESDARQRLVETADRLFYAEGVRAMGIDRIIDESGVAKMTLYSHFRSKDELVQAVLRHREEQFTGWFVGAMERNLGESADRLIALFAALKARLRDRIQAVIAHEKAEYENHRDHELALIAAPETGLPISRAARELLRAQEAGWKGHPR